MKESLYISLIGVEPSKHKKGIGAALVQKAAELADEQGVDATLFTEKASSVRLYSRFGFDVIGQDKGCFRGEEFECWCMRRSKAKGETKDSA